MTRLTAIQYGSRIRLNLSSVSKLRRRGDRRRWISYTVQAQAEEEKVVKDKSKVAFLFPGQGAQKIGMAKVVKEVHAAGVLFDKASDVLGYDLLKICIEGPKEQLDSTVISQPALFVSGLAAVEKLRATQGQDIIDGCDVTAGLSLGEYTALTFADAMTFEDGLKLVKLRGEAMQAASDAVDSSMVEELCAEATSRVGGDAFVQIANYLCPGNYTVSGTQAACQLLQEIAKPEFKARMTVKLAVAGAFHTPCMKPAVAPLKAALKTTPIATPRIPVISNVDAKSHSDPDDIRSILSRQITSPVRWEQSIKQLLESGLTKSYELGPGTVISGIFKRINKTHPVENIEV